MKIKVPKKIQIGAHTYKIKIDKNLKGDGNRYGEVNYRTQEITLWGGCNPSLMMETLLHEVIHIGEFAFRIAISDEDIDRVAETITMLLRNNLDIEFVWDNIK